MRCAYFEHLKVRQLAVPASAALAVQTRTAQLQDKVEQQHLKRLVLDYEQREEAEELRGKGIRRICNKAKQFIQPSRLVTA